MNIISGCNVHARSEEFNRKGFECECGSQAEIGIHFESDAKSTAIVKMGYVITHAQHSKVEIRKLARSCSRHTTHSITIVVIHIPHKNSSSSVKRRTSSVSSLSLSFSLSQFSITSIHIRDICEMMLVTCDKLWEIFRWYYDEYNAIQHYKLTPLLANICIFRRVFLFDHNLMISGDSFSYLLQFLRRFRFFVSDIKDPQWHNVLILPPKTFAISTMKYTENTNRSLSVSAFLVLLLFISHSILNTITHLIFNWFGKKRDPIPIPLYEMVFHSSGIPHSLEMATNATHFRI